MFLCLCDSRLIIWNLTDERFLSKPVFRLPSRILGAFLVKTNLCFVVHDGEEVKLSIVENQRLKDLMRVHVGDDSLLSLLSVKEDILTFLGDQSVFRLHLDTSEIVSETFLTLPHFYTYLSTKFRGCEAVMQMYNTLDDIINIDDNKFYQHQFF